MPSHYTTRAEQCLPKRNRHAVGFTPNLGRIARMVGFAPNLGRKTELASVGIAPDAGQAIHSAVVGLAPNAGYITIGHASIRAIVGFAPDAGHTAGFPPGAGHAMKTAGFAPSAGHTIHAVMCQESIHAMVVGIVQNPSAVTGLRDEIWTEMTFYRGENACRTVLAWTTLRDEIIHGLTATRDARVWDEAALCACDASAKEAPPLGQYARTGKPDLSTPLKSYG